MQGGSHRKPLSHYLACHTGVVATIRSSDIPGKEKSILTVGVCVGQGPPEAGTDVGVRT